MSYNRLKTKPAYYLLFAIVATMLWHCVPLKKQMIVKDMKRKTLRELRKTDTTLIYQPFEYRLKSGDVLSISLTSFAKGEYDLSSLSQQGNIAMGGVGPGGQAGAQGGGQGGITGYTVNDSGFVIFPVLGKIKVGELSLKESRLLVQKKVNEILDNTNANLQMVNYYIYMMGEITTQGQLFAPKDRITLLEAVALAGGFTDFADRSNIKIVRNQGNTAHIYYVSLANQDLLTMQKVYLLPNDIIIVEPLRAKVVRNYTIPNISLIVSSLTLVFTLSLAFSNLLNRR